MEMKSSIYYRYKDVPVDLAKMMLNLHNIRKSAIQGTTKDNFHCEPGNSASNSDSKGDSNGEFDSNALKNDCIENDDDLTEVFVDQTQTAQNTQVILNEFDGSVTYESHSSPATMELSQTVSDELENDEELPSASKRRHLNDPINVRSSKADVRRQETDCLSGDKDPLDSRSTHSGTHMTVKMSEKLFNKFLKKGQISLNKGEFYLDDDD